MHRTTGGAAPTADADRVSILDALRGFALAGIFLVNLGSFTGFIFMKPEALAALPTAVLDRPAALMIVWLTYGKFYSLFSLLFGIGCASSGAGSPCCSCSARCTCISGRGTSSSSTR